MLQRSPPFKRASVLNPEQKVADLPRAQCTNPLSIRWFVNQGGNVNAIVHGMYITKQTPLHIAAESDASAAVHALLDAGADPNILSVNNSTPLHDAVKQRAWNVVGILVQAGARTDLKNNFNKTPYDIASEEFASDVVLQMLQPVDQLTARQEKSARVAMMVRQGSLRSTASTTAAATQPYAEEAPYRSPENIASVLVGEGVISQNVGSFLIQAQADTELLKFCDDEAYKEIGVTSALDRARIKTWLAKKGYLK